MLFFIVIGLLIINFKCEDDIIINLDLSQCMETYNTPIFNNKLKPEESFKKCMDYFETTLKLYFKVMILNPRKNPFDIIIEVKLGKCINVDMFDEYKVRSGEMTKNHMDYIANNLTSILKYIEQKFFILFDVKLRFILNKCMMEHCDKVDQFEGLKTCTEYYEIILESIVKYIDTKIIPS